MGKDNCNQRKKNIAKNKLINWKYILDVANCAGTQYEVENYGEYGVYICPDLGRSYSHRRALYFGSYKNKVVSSIYYIDAVVIVKQNLIGADILWKRENMSDDSKLEERAMNYLRELRKDEIKTRNLKVFLLSNRKDVSFQKNTPGGLRSSKIYFEFPGCESIDDVENEIKQKEVWSAVR